MTPYQQELANIRRFQRGLTETPAALAQDPVGRRVDAVTARVRAQISASGNTLLSAARSRQASIDAARAQLAGDLDALIHELCVPGNVIAAALALYGTNEVQPGSPTGEIINSWRDLHAELQKVDPDALGHQEENELPEQSAEPVSADDQGDQGSVLRQVLCLTDLSSGHVQVINLVQAKLQGDTWTLTADTDLPGHAAAGTLRVSTTGGRVASFPASQNIQVHGRNLHVHGLNDSQRRQVRPLRVQDLGQVSVLR